jgi:hypothetical protein
VSQATQALPSPLSTFVLGREGAAQANASAAQPRPNPS